MALVLPLGVGVFDELADRFALGVAVVHGGLALSIVENGGNFPRARRKEARYVYVLGSQHGLRPPDSIGQETERDREQHDSEKQQERQHMPSRDKVRRDYSSSVW